MASHSSFLISIMAFLLTVVVVAPVMKRLQLSPLLGYLAVGAAVGPFALGWVNDPQSLRALAELGVVFLLFSLGLELSFSRLRQSLKLILGLGSLQWLGCAAVIATVAAFWGNALGVALIIGLCLALSSTAMVVPLLQERGELGSLAGRACFGVLLLQDIAVVPTLILLGLLGGAQPVSLGESLGIALIKGLCALAIIMVLGRYLLRYALQKALASHRVEVFMATLLLAILATAYLTEAAGLSLSLGAFLAGLLLAETEFRHQIETELEPVKGLFMALFFISVGMNLNLPLAFNQGLWLVASVLGLMALKAMVTSLAARALGIPWGPALFAGLTLAQAGEFAFVVIGQATLVYGLMSEAVGQFMVVLAGLSMLLTPGAMALGRFLQTRLSRTQLRPLAEPPHPTPMLAPPRVIVAGFGRVGRALARVLEREGIPYMAIDKHTETVTAARIRQQPVVLGDARKPDFLQKVGLTTAEALVITMDNPAAALHSLHASRQLKPDLPVFVRSRDADHSSLLRQAGALAVVPETLEVSLQLASVTLQALGTPPSEVHAYIDQLRQEGLNGWLNLEPDAAAP